MNNERVPRVVLGVSGTDASANAVAYASMVTGVRGEMMLVSAVRRTRRSAWSRREEHAWADALGADAHQLADAWQITEIQREAHEAAQAHGPVSTHEVIREGDPFTVLRDVCDEMRADQLVLGGNGGPSRLARRLGKQSGGDVVVIDSASGLVIPVEPARARRATATWSPVGRVSMAPERA